MTLFEVPTAVLFGQLMLGLINGSFYAALSLGLSVIFGVLRIVNFAHGAFYMLGAYGAWILSAYLGLGFWPALMLVPLAAGLVGIAVDKVLIERVRDLHHLYGLLLTFGVALIIQALFRLQYGSSGLSYAVPPELKGAQNLGFMVLPNYRAFVVVFSLTVCIAAWYAIERTSLGAKLRAATENPVLTEVFGINVPLLVTVMYGFGVALAALAGVLAAAIYSVAPTMGADLLIVVFAVVVIGGMGSLGGSIVAGVGLGVIEGLTKVVYPEGASIVIFLIMAVVLLVRPAGLFGRTV
jgi:branched-chain amino acid transport system permease protein